MIFHEDKVKYSLTHRKLCKKMLFGIFSGSYQHMILPWLDMEDASLQSEALCFQNRAKVALLPRGLPLLRLSFGIGDLRS